MGFLWDLFGRILFCATLLVGFYKFVEFGDVKNKNRMYDAVYGICFFILALLLQGNL